MTRRISNRTFIAVVVAAGLALTACSDQEPHKDPGSTKQEAAGKARTAPGKLEELAFEQQSLKGQLDRLQKSSVRLTRLEDELKKTRTELRQLENEFAAYRRKAANKPVVAPGYVKKSASPEKKRLVLPEPVPTGAVGKKETAEVAAAGTEPAGTEAAGTEAAGTEAAGTEAATGEAKVPVPVGEVGVVNIKFAKGVDRENRRPVEETDTFLSSDNRIYAWLVLSNLAPEETQVILSWNHDGKELSSIDLQVGAKTSHWRTWAYTRPSAKHLGTWEVQIKNVAGKLLGSASFVVKE